MGFSIIEMVVVSAIVIVTILLEFSPKKYRGFLIKSFKFFGWTLLFLGIIAIFIGYTTAEPESGFSGLGNVILFLGGIICSFVGLSFITGWFSMWQSGSLYDSEWSWSRIIHGNEMNDNLNTDLDLGATKLEDLEFGDELIGQSESDTNSESNTGLGGSLKLVIGISAGLIILLSLAIAGLWILSEAANITIGGPPSALLTWEDEYRDMTGVDAVSGLSLIHI